MLSQESKTLHMIFACAMLSLASQTTFNRICPCGMLRGASQRQQYTGFLPVQCFRKIIQFILLK